MVKTDFTKESFQVEDSYIEKYLLKIEKVTKF